MPHCSNSLAQQIGSTFGSASEAASPPARRKPFCSLYLATTALSPGATLTTQKRKSIVSSVNRLLFSSIYLLRHLGQIFAIRLKSVEHGCLQIFTLMVTKALLPLSVTSTLAIFFKLRFCHLNTHIHYSLPRREGSTCTTEAEEAWVVTHYGASGRVFHLLPLLFKGKCVWWLFEV